MRALVDANVFIRHFIAPGKSTPPVLWTEAAMSGAYALLVTEGVVGEIAHKTTTRPYLVRRITPAQTARLVTLLRAKAEWIPELAPPFPEIGDDRKDDYLFAHAAFGRADSLVSRDSGVRGIERIGDVMFGSSLPPSSSRSWTTSAGLTISPAACGRLPPIEPT